MCAVVESWKEMGYLDPGPRGELRNLGERAEREVAGVDVQLVRLQAGQELVLCGKANVNNYRSTSHHSHQSSMRLLLLHFFLSNVLTASALQTVLAICLQSCLRKCDLSTVSSVIINEYNFSLSSWLLRHISANTL